jgi:hypothetical protein
MTNSANGEAIFQELLETLLRNSYTPITWEGFTPYGQLPSRPRLRDRHEVVVDPKLLHRCVGRYQVSPDIVLAVTQEVNRLIVQENDEPKQELGAESETQFFSRVADDQYTFVVDETGRATRLILHTDGRDIPSIRIAP